MFGLGRNAWCSGWAAMITILMWTRSYFLTTADIDWNGKIVLFKAALT